MSLTFTVEVLGIQMAILSGQPLPGYSSWPPVFHLQAGPWQKQSSKSNVVLARSFVPTSIILVHYWAEYQQNRPYLGIYSHQGFNTACIFTQEQHPSIPYTLQQFQATSNIVAKSLHLYHQISSHTWFWGSSLHHVHDRWCWHKKLLPWQAREGTRLSSPLGSSKWLFW